MCLFCVVLLVIAAKLKNTARQCLIGFKLMLWTCGCHSSAIPLVHVILYAKELDTAIKLLIRQKYWNEEITYIHLPWYITGGLSIYICRYIQQYQRCVWLPDFLSVGSHQFCSQSLRAVTVPLPHVTKSNQVPHASAHRAGGILGHILHTAIPSNSRSRCWLEYIGNL